MSTEWRSPFKAAKWAEEAKEIAVAAIRGTQVTFIMYTNYAKFKNFTHFCTNYAVVYTTHKYVVHTMIIYF